jgi:hypothetical protein
MKSKIEPKSGDYVIVIYDIYDDKFIVKKVRRFCSETKRVYFHDSTTCKLEECQPFIGKLPERDSK